jgi:hypothetical protein
VTIQQDVDKLIDAYQLNGQAVTVVKVKCRPRTLRKFAKKERRGPFKYRGYELIAVKPKKEEPPQ